MKKIIPILLMVILLVIIRNIIVSIRDLSGKNSIVSDLKGQLVEKRRENEFLKEKLFYVKTDKYVENEAREKLGLVKKGEYIVVAPSEKSEKKQEIKDERPNWEKWWNLFFK